MAEGKIEVNKPKPFNPDKNRISKDWRVWKEEFRIYLEISEKFLKLTEKDKAYLLLNLMGTEAFIAKGKMEFNDSKEEEDLDILLRKFDEIYDPPLNEAEERYKFFSRRKRQNESIDRFIEVLKEQASRCNFGDQKDKFIVDMVIRTMDKYLQKCVFMQEDLSLSSIITFYNKHSINYEKFEKLHFHKSTDSILSDTKSKFKQDSYLEEKNEKVPYNNLNDVFKDKTKLFDDCSVKHKKEIYKPSVAETENCLWCGTKHAPGQCRHDVDCTSCTSFPHNICFQCKKNPHENNCYYKSIVTLPTNIVLPCSKCGTNHPYALCPARNEICPNCYKKGHYQRVCKNQPVLQKIFDSHEEPSSSGNINAPKERAICLKCETYHSPTKCPFGVICDEKNTYKGLCLKCGTNHPSKQCPAYNQRCVNCKEIGHFTQVCKNQSIVVSSKNCPVCGTYTEQRKDGYYCYICRKISYEGNIDSNPVGAHSRSRTRSRTRSREGRSRKSRSRKNNSKKDYDSCIIS